MSLSKRELSGRGKSIVLDFDLLSRDLKCTCPHIVFALVLGSAAGGHIEAGSDLDIAVFLDEKPTLKIVGNVVETVEKHAPGVEVDLGILNGNEPVYRFEALKGRLLFTVDQDEWLGFFSLTCREYEHWMYHYEKQRRYRLEE